MTDNSRERREPASADGVDRVAARAARGDETALAALIRLTQRDVWRACAALVDAASADDLAQETYLRAIRALPGYRGDSSARTWLLAIARRTCADELRRRAAGSRLRGRLMPAPAAPDHAGLTDLLVLMRALDPRRREAFVLTQVIGLSYDEAAVACGCPVGTIRSRVARARDDLVDALRVAPAGRRRR